MNDFNAKLNEFYERLGNAKKMVLATSKNDRVTARTMSFVIIDGLFYFQTDSKMLKYEQITQNSKVAVCIDNIQIEAETTIMGHPLDSQNSFFAEAFKDAYRSSFELYTALCDEVVVKVEPKRITLWKYEDKKPYRVFFDIEKRGYEEEVYVG